MEPVLAEGKEVGLLVALIGRRTRDEAVEAARSMVAGLGESSRAAQQGFERASDSVAFRST